MLAFFLYRMYRFIMYVDDASLLIWCIAPVALWILQNPSIAEEWSGRNRRFPCVIITIIPN
jgi:hypothetical protein